MANKAYKFRLYPTPEQKSYLARCFGYSRFVYNHFLRLTTDAYAECKKHLRYGDTAKLLTLLKKDEQYSWLTKVNSQSLQQTLKDLESAFVRFFKKLGGFPVFKKKRNRQSFRVPQHWSISPDGKLKLPKMQPIKMVQHREIEGTPTSVTIIQTPTGKYYACILVEYDQKQAPLNGGKIGADLGLKEFLITGEGKKYPNPRFYRRALKRLKRLQRSLSRKVKGSTSRNKQRLLVAMAHEKVANQRLDMQHKLSLQLTCDNQVVAVEDLHIKGMVKNHKLAQAISDAAWGQFLTLLEYKGKLYGCEIRKLDRFFPSSKRCSKCGYIHENLTLDIREWVCLECGTHHDRDVNAATNILAFSNPQIRQELPESTPKEPVERQGYQGGYSLGLGSP
ncbi:MAG: transposase [Aphanothece sp. CMT-3BRIN-NPC111]|jgi:putative transposase|nr:transposase [Aphanothece sp. CMT-3BRIN-NPC111]